MRKLEKEAYGYIKDMFVQHNMVKRIVFTVIAVLVMGFGISLFSVSGFGVDPFTSMNMNISSCLGIGYGTYQMIVNAFIILFVVAFAHRGLIGIGTMFNMVCVGYSCEMFEGIVAPVVAPLASNFAFRVGLLAVGIIVLCFSCSLFFTTSIGVGPYDALSFYISQKLDITYKWVRVATDLLVVVAGVAFSAIANGGFDGVANVGIGTIITAFMMGPLVNFFSKHVSSKLLDVDYAGVSKDVAFFMLKGALLKNNIGYNPAEKEDAFGVLGAELEAIKVVD